MMQAAEGWTQSKPSDGVLSVQLHSWIYFYEYIREQLIDHDYVYRGQRCSDWALEPSLHRLARRYHLQSYAQHFQQFKRAVRGRRGANPPHIESDNEWWALGQHYGLATPLLDWSTSPFVGAFFAFVEEGGRDQTDTRAVYALSRSAMRRRVENMEQDDPAPIVEFVSPQSDENPRLLSQGGLFTRVPKGDDIESWVRRHFSGNHTDKVLVKITIPDPDREECLKELNAMNINPLSLFPDLHGAGLFCNLHFTVRCY